MTHRQAPALSKQLNFEARLLLDGDPLYEDRPWAVSGVYGRPARLWPSPKARSPGARAFWRGRSGQAAGRER